MVYITVPKALAFILSIYFFEFFLLICYQYKHYSQFRNYNFQKNSLYMCVYLGVWVTTLLYYFFNGDLAGLRFV